MKKIALFIFLILFGFLSFASASQNLKVFTGKVTAIDPDGKAIVVKEKVGKSEMVVGAIVTPETVVEISGKKGELKDIKIGDRVTLIYERTTDLYAKKIVKK